MKIAYYDAPISEFLYADGDAILGELIRAHGFSLEHQQRDAWVEQIRILKIALADWDAGHILFEFAIPRMGKRADAVIVACGIVMVVEFKVGATAIDRAAIDQVHDYALDLKNFHRGSHDLPIVPFAVATRADSQRTPEFEWAADMVSEPVGANATDIGKLLMAAIECGPHTPIDFNEWRLSGYQPTPTIVEAAQALYQHHGVEEISRSDSGAYNLSVTSECIAEVIERSKRQNRKSICLVTGVPGAGKTLAGLNIATKRAQEHSDEHAVFLSGNGPLVSVLREALARDESERVGCSKLDAKRKVASFIQNIHHFRDEALRDQTAPHEHVVIFDEAQRAWTRDQTSRFMQTKRGQSGFDMSEPEFLLGVMDRHSDWCVVVCLIGGGQEINTGEAGLAEWLSALKFQFAHWDLYASSRLEDADYVNLGDHKDFLDGPNVTPQSELHLAVSIRSFRAETLSAFVGHLVDGRADKAREIFSDISGRYPIVITRELEQAKRWLEEKSRGSERYGILASSGAYRLRPYGLCVKAKIDPPIWFLNDRTDVRSSYYCEDVATEFDIQGLELDWACACWDADFRYFGGDWSHNSFRGTRWQRVNSDDGKLYLKNAYRVILTRARQGMVIFVPPGLPEDPTRLPAHYEETYQYLKACGISALDDAGSIA